MAIETQIMEAIGLFQFPFMQRAMIGGILIGSMGGLLGSFTILRQLSFFSEALGDSALLGISLGLMMGLNTSVILLPFAVIFGLGVAQLLQRTKLATDTLLNLICSACLAVSIILLNFLDQYKGGINNLLFGDILAIQTNDLWISGVLLMLCVGFLLLTFRAQILLTLHEPMAIARGVNADAYRTGFIILLALVVAVAIKAIGVLLVSAFIVIPAAAARLWSRNFTTHVVLSMVLGAISAIIGIVASAVLNLPSGPTIVITQFLVFLLGILTPRLFQLSPNP